MVKKQFLLMELISQNLEKVILNNMDVIYKISILEVNV